MRWFALPAVSGMALDMGGVQFTAAPSSGVYQGTEIGSVNLGDPHRCDRLPAVAEALGLDVSRGNPLWRDHAIVELNRAVLHGFAEAGVAALRPRGRLVQVDVTGDTPMPINALVAREILVQGTHRFHAEFAEAVAVITSGRIDVQPIVTFRYPLEDAVAAFRTDADRTRSVKVHLTFDSA